MKLDSSFEFVIQPRSPLLPIIPHSKSINNHPKQHLNPVIPKSNLYTKHICEGIEHTQYCMVY